MTNTKSCRLTLLVGSVLLWPADRLLADEPQTTTLAPAAVQVIVVHPAQVQLKGRDDSRQLLVTGTLTTGQELDLSAAVRYEPDDHRIVRVTAAGRLIPLANGSTRVRASSGNRDATVTVHVEAQEVDLPINFGNQIVPIFTKLGCNAGACHGKASGQNGFKLSLLGFEPEHDFAALVKEARGRRVFPAAPEHSLLLMKATGSVAHAGGKRLETDADEYKLIRRWIAAGTPWGRSADPVVTRISIAPARQVLRPQGRQQLAVLAHYSDGSAVDITYRALYQSNDTEVAAVDANGVVRTLDQTGEAAIMARFQGHVATFRAVVPRVAKAAAYSFEPRTLVDSFTHKKWQELGLAPSEPCSDAQFLRRVALDITGTLPTPSQVQKFLAERDPHKRDKLVDALLETPEYSYFFANKWASILKVRGKMGMTGAAAFHDWIVEAMAQDRPYDEFVRALVAASGDERSNPPAAWFKNRHPYTDQSGPRLPDGFKIVGNPSQFVDETAQLFLGQRLACAQCHHHPYERWSQDDYWGLAAFFGRLTRKFIQPIGQDGVVRSRDDQVVPQFIFARSTGQVTNPRTGKPAVMKLLDGGPLQVEPEDDPRQKLADWMVSPQNPYFARAVANRYWAHFFNRGLVEPIDDMRATNPPTNPELLDALATEFVENKFSLKHLIRVMCKSRTYQLSSVPNDVNKHDKQTYARYYPRRLIAEAIHDAVVQVTNAAPAFTSVPHDAHAPWRAIMLSSATQASYFLDVFGRPERLTACECERSSDVNLAQVIHLLNSRQVHGMVARDGGRAHTLARDPRPDTDKIDELFLWFYGRMPTAPQRELALTNVEAHARDKKAAYENIIWALLNTKEFIFNH